MRELGPEQADPTAPVEADIADSSLSGPERLDGDIRDGDIRDEVSAILLERPDPRPPGGRPGRRPERPAVVPPRPIGVTEHLITAAPHTLRDRLLADPVQRDARPSATRQSVEAVLLARGGGVMIVGWIDDLTCPLDAITVSTASWRVCFDARTLVRTRRSDAEEALQSGPLHLFGYFGLVAAANLEDVEERARIDVQFANGGQVTTEIATRVVTPAELRDIALGYLAAAQFFGNAQVEGVACLDPGPGTSGNGTSGLGEQAVALNLSITNRIVAARHIERFGTPRRQPAGSIVVCLYGRADFLFVQNALFADLPGIEDYEFIFVSNSPEISEDLAREARLAHRIYGLNQTVIVLPGNAGFGAANNVAAASALSRRILIVNPDVFPRQRDWALRHTDLVAAMPAEQTGLFGVPLYYDDGSLMHGGMYFELDSAASVQAGTIERRRMLRVEHYGKGAPDWAATYTRTRPVPAVTGAFMSADRTWFERLGGFTEDYIFGHYEDADLCLKSLDRGMAVWLHDLRLWHLEGWGSTRRPHHEGGSLINRWYFTKRWLPMITAGLLGPEPTHLAMATDTPPRAGRRRPATPAVRDLG